MKKQFCRGEMPAASPLLFDEDKCIGCNRCVDICQVDLLLPDTEGGKTPIVAFPGECWYCGCCVMECPRGAIRLRHPLMNQARWVEKSSLGAQKKDGS